MRRRLLLIGLVVLIPACGIVKSCAPVLVFGQTRVSRTRAFGWNNPALCFVAWGNSEASIDRMIWLLPCFPSIKEVRVAPISLLNEVTPLSDRLSSLAKNPWLVSLDLGNVGATDADIASLEGMSQLEWLDLHANPRITDKGIGQLAKCTRLRHLNLDGTRVTPAGIAALVNCQELSYLSMHECVVTDENVAMIPRFSKMYYLVFDGAALTEKGLSHFVDWHFLNAFAPSAALPGEARLEFNRKFKEAWERAKAAGEDVPLDRHRGRPL
jgi:Leucine rich repeat